jgi:hypothetical protein
MTAMNKFPLQTKTLCARSGNNNDTKSVVKNNLNTAGFSHELWIGVLFPENTANRNRFIGIYMDAIFMLKTPSVRMFTQV